MNCLSDSLPRVLSAGVVTASLLYPLVVYVGLQRLPPLVMVAFALALIGARLLTLGNEAARVWRAPLLAVAAGLAFLASVDQTLAVLAYPVLLGLGMAVLFGHSLLRPPSLVERLARLTDPNFPNDGVGYCRAVTLVWTLFLVANAAVAAGLALWGTPEAWALWTGLIAYLLMGALFAGEFLVRRILLRRRGES